MLYTGELCWKEADFHELPRYLSQDTVQARDVGIAAWLMLKAPYKRRLVDMGVSRNFETSHNQTESNGLETAFT